MPKIKPFEYRPYGIKPVKAWAYSNDGKTVVADPLNVFSRKHHAINKDKLIRVEIRVIQPKRKTKGRK